MNKNLNLHLSPYPNEKVLLWAVTVKEIEASGNIPQIVLPNLNPENKPVVAVILAQDYNPETKVKDYTVFPDYIDAILMHNAYPVFIYYEQVKAQLEQVKPDAILLLGGNFRLLKEQGKDYEARPKTYLQMIEYAKEHKLPLFAICGGEQILAVTFGAGVQLNLDRTPTCLNHLQKPYETTHKVTLCPNSQIARILGPEISVNSCHRTAVTVDASNPDIFISGISSDGISEVVEFKNPWSDFLIGVQWHPERLVKIGDTDSIKLFKAFIDTAAKHRLK